MLDFYRNWLHRLPAEAAHNLAILGLRYWKPTKRYYDCDSLQQTLWGKHFNHPIGLAAGFDKHAEAYSGLSRLGFSFIEVGSITPLPQPGNPRPRLFRLPENQAIVNRYGFNSKGMDYACRQLASRQCDAILGVNIGKNKDSTSDISDFITAAEVLLPYADYITVNLSSPNTPGLRDLQHQSRIYPLLEQLVKQRALLRPACPILIKLSPDMPPIEEADLLVYLAESPIDGLIVSNTTIDRVMLSALPNHLLHGGISGLPLRNRSRAMLQRAYTILKGRKPIIASGGIDSGEEAYLRICLGASLCQVYTAFIYQGSSLLPKMLSELKQCLLRDGFNNINQAIGSYYAKH
ncbi:MAG: quinone-dependent dihydroorotate dehydrogenase [Pseudomonadota bacterium]